MTKGPAPEPLPWELTEAFRVATALDTGVSPARLRARDLDASVHGVRSRTPITGLRSRCLAFAQRYPDAAFSHATAALLWGAPLPLSLERDIAVDIAVRAPSRAPHAAGVRGHRIPDRLDDLAWHSGIRVTTPAWTWLDLGAHLDLPDLVAVGDYLIHRDLPLTSRTSSVACWTRCLAPTAARVFAAPWRSSRMPPNHDRSRCSGSRSALAVCRMRE